MRRLTCINRNHEDQAGPAAKADYKTDPDDLVFLKKEHPMSLKDEKDLKGRTLWVSAGGQMDYYPYNGHTVDFAHTQGVLLGAEPIVVTDAIEEVAPKSTAIRIPHGDKQVLLVFTEPRGTDPAKQFALQVGSVTGADVSLLTDEIFFYTDPHKLFELLGSAGVGGDRRAQGNTRHDGARNADGAGPGERSTRGYGGRSQRDV